MESQQLIASVLSGGGEMGERMRAFDWSTTALDMRAGVWCHDTNKGSSS
jgi:hypothetical protein